MERLWKNAEFLLRIWVLPSAVPPFPEDKSIGGVEQPWLERWECQIQQHCGFSRSIPEAP